MATIVYVSCAEDKQVVGFEMAGNGALREVLRVAIPGTDAPSPSSLPLAVSPDRRFLYAALRSEPYPVLTFAIGAGGALTLAGTARLGHSMCYLATDRTGTRLFAASYGGNTLGVAPIRDGIAGDVAQVIGTPPKAHCVLPDPANRFVYAACLGGDVILAQRFDGAALSPTPHVAAHTRAGAGPRHLAFAAGGERLYCLNELDGSVNAYARDLATGALHELQSLSALPAPAAGPVAAADLHLTPDERFLYASERMTHTLAAFRVDAATGRLSLIGHVPAERAPRGFAITPLGTFLFCAGLESGAVATYAIDPGSGALRRICTVQAGAGANWVEVIEV